MGNDQQLINNKNSTLIKNDKRITPNSFKFLIVIGKGGFGKVWKVLYKKYQTIYAIKQMSKFKIVQKNCVSSINDELKILSKIDHPFIMKIYFAFQDEDYLYLVMDYLESGDLRYQIKHREEKFSENLIQIFSANIMMSLDYLHYNNIIHRDLKPENLVFDNKGYIKLTDFGIAKIIKADMSKETSGTPGYMAPEVLFGKNHSYTADYFSLGVIIYELVLGDRPYHGINRKELREKIYSRQAKIKKNEIPPGISVECVDFINSLIKRRPCDRIGYNGIKELFDHKWFKNYNWRNLYSKRMKINFVPLRKELDYDSNDIESDIYQKVSNNYDSETIEKLVMFKTDPESTKLFIDYYFYFNQFDHFDIANTKVEKYENPHLILENKIKKKKKKFIPIVHDEDNKCGFIKNMLISHLRENVFNHKNKNKLLKNKRNHSSTKNYYCKNILTTNNTNNYSNHSIKETDSTIDQNTYQKTADNLTHKYSPKTTNNNNYYNNCNDIFNNNYTSRK